MHINVGDLTHVLREMEFPKGSTGYKIINRIKGAGTTGTVVSTPSNTQG